MAHRGTGAFARLGSAERAGTGFAATREVCWIKLAYRGSEGREFKSHRPDHFA
jgi:hypothetical protein